MGATLHIRGRLALPVDELTIRASRSSGPGGQHANVTASRIEVVFDVNASSVLSDAERELLLQRLGPVVTAISQDARSQRRNREVALDRLAEKLRTALHVDKPRTKTRPTRGSVERRLGAKKRAASTKATRRKPRFDD
ncbi:MAG: alternative ribosome rescue aminoacyl-tRNA hydrolase ArfB [Patulibacter minatonensis]